MDPLLLLFIGGALLIAAVVGGVVFFLTKSVFFKKGCEVGFEEGRQKGYGEGVGKPAPANKMKPGIYKLGMIWESGEDKDDKKKCFATQVIAGKIVVVRTWSAGSMACFGPFDSANWVASDGKVLVFSEQEPAKDMVFPAPPIESTQRPPSEVLDKPLSSTKKTGLTGGLSLGGGRSNSVFCG